VATSNKLTAKQPTAERGPSIVVACIVSAIAAVLIWYLVRPEPLLIQGEVDATRMDLAARVDGRVGEIPVEREQDDPAGAVLVRIDNPETLAKLKQAVAAKVVAEAQLANINVGTRAEVIAARKAELERAQAAVALAQKTFDRTNQLAQERFSPQAQLDLAKDRLEEAQKAAEQAQSAYSQAVNEYTKEEREIAVTNVQKAAADIESVQSIIDQMVVYAPVASQVYKRNAEPGEFISLARWRFACAPPGPAGREDSVPLGSCAWTHRLSPPSRP
jgi:HlyD family secretion protein